MSAVSMRFTRYQSLFYRYGIAALAVEAAILLRWLANPWLGQAYPLVLVFAAVAASVWYGGPGPAIFAMIAGYCAASYLFISPPQLISLHNAADFAGLAAYVLSCGVIILLIEATRKAEQRLRLSQDAALHGYAMLSGVRDNKQRIVDFRWSYINPMGARMLGYSPQQMIGHRLLHLLPEEKGQPGLFRAMAQVAQTGEPADLEVHYEYGDLEGWFRNLVVKQGDGVLASFTDITDRKKLEAALLEQSENLRQADRRKTEFVAMLAHELRNPLAPIRTSLYLIRAADQEQRVAPYTAVIERQVKHMVRLIEDLLDLNRIDTGKLEVRPEAVDLNAVIQEALDTVQPSIEQRAQHLKVKLPEQPVYLSLDPVRMAQVFSNLLDNATEFTPRGGHLSLSVSRDERGVQVDVVDEGPGIPKARLGSIFEPFSLVDRSEERTTLGMGLGLSLVKRMVELHGGRIEAHSEGPGKGSRFSVRLPSTLLIAAPSKKAPAEEVQPAHYKAKVVVVDDNSDAAETLARVLTTHGHEVHVAFDGAQAVQQIAQTRPEAALVDIGLPKLNGYEVAKAIRDNRWGDRMVLIAVTGWGTADDKQKAVEAGFDYHLTKPVDFAELHRLLDSPRRVSPD